MLSTNTRIVFAALVAALCGPAALAQKTPAGNSPVPPSGAAAPQPGASRQQTPARGVVPNRQFRTFDPYRNYGGFRLLPTDNEVHHYNAPQSPFTAYRPRYRSYYRQYNYSNYTYANGLYTNGIFNYDWASAVFPNGNAFYPYYVPDFVPGGTFFSPYSYYTQAAPSFILADTVYFAPPQVVYVPVPVYADGSYRGVQRADIEDYYLNRAPKQDDASAVGGKNGAAQTLQDRLIDRAAADITSAWKSGDIEKLAPYIDSKAKIAVYLRGKYQYSLDARDYLDLTRDALTATKTVRFDLDPPVRKERGVYTLTGKHVYKNKDGDERTVYVNYALELQDGKYQITQVGSAPEKVEDYKIGE